MPLNSASARASSVPTLAICSAAEGYWRSLCPRRIIQAGYVEHSSGGISRRGSNSKRDLETLTRLLREHAGLVTARLRGTNKIGDSGSPARTLLHVGTDWA